MIARIPPDHPLWPKTFPEKLAPLRAEFETYYRELPQLIEDGQDGRYAIIKGAEFGGTWDTYRDALQYGYDRFGTGPFLAQQVDVRHLDAMSGWFAPAAQSTEGAV